MAKKQSAQKFTGKAVMGNATAEQISELRELIKKCNITWHSSITQRHAEVLNSEIQRRIRQEIKGTLSTGRANELIDAMHKGPIGSLRIQGALNLTNENLYEIFFDGQHGYIKCPKCWGRGSCGKCDGRGAELTVPNMTKFILAAVQDKIGKDLSVKPDMCPACGGTGWCRVCGGEKAIPLAKGGALKPILLIVAILAIASIGAIWWFSH